MPIFTIFFQRRGSLLHVFAKYPVSPWWNCLFPKQRHGFSEMVAVISCYPPGKPTFWRCISYWTWGFSNVMLVFRGCVSYPGVQKKMHVFYKQWDPSMSHSKSSGGCTERWHYSIGIYIETCTSNVAFTPAKLIQGNKWPNNPRQAVGYTFQGRDCDRCRSSSEETEVQSHPFTFRGVSERCGFCFPHAIAWLEHISWHDFSYRVFDMMMCQIFFIELSGWGFLVEQLGEFSLQLLDTSSSTCMADLYTHFLQQW